MAFKKTAPPSTVPPSPDLLLRDLPRRKIPDVLPHQREVMRTYAAQALSDSDVALQLPTGSGKTLVGLLIAEWRRRKNRERVVYLCPTRQLVNQVMEQADEKYGLTVLPFTGSAREYDPTSKAEYRNADRVAVTTYSSVFNTKPFFNDADILIVDDVHAGEGYISGLWSVRVDREKHESLHAALRNVLKPLLNATNFARLSGKVECSADRLWIEKIPTPQFASVQAEVAEVLDAHVDNTDLQYGWSGVRDHLHACHIYLSSQEILIRPLIAPTWTHAAFDSPKQRVYMSATLGAGGDLERLVGRRSIRRIPTPEGWDRQGVGRRFFVFPTMSLSEPDAAELRRELMKIAGRSLVLVPSDRIRDEIAKDVEDNLGFKTFSASDIEESKRPFIRTTEAVAIVANRYDGIDFPGDECRLLFVDGLPRATNIQERFLMSRMGANILFNERIQTRVLQAIGRCTRSLEDYSAVVVTGDELPDYLTDLRRRKYLHPEVQAELSFGIEQSKGTSFDDIIENFRTFLANGEDWEEVNQQIVEERKQHAQEPFPAMDNLASVVSHEIGFLAAHWQSDYEQALASAERVLGGLDAPELRGYRALWHYLAGSAAWLGNQAGATNLAAKSRMHYERAKSAAPDLQWLVHLARYHPSATATPPSDSVILEQIERVESVLSQLGIVHDRAFAAREKEILDGLSTEDGFEQAQKLLGELVGFDSGKIEGEGSPDPWWIAGNLCLVFEDYVGAKQDSQIDITKARQVSSHPAWMRANVERCVNTDILPVLVTPVGKVKKSALPFLMGVAFWSLRDFQDWARLALSTVRELRKTFVESGDLGWRQKAIEMFQQNGLGATGLFLQLQSRQAVTQLREVK